jgi:hypothetical protein
MAGCHDDDDNDNAEVDSDNWVDWQGLDDRPDCSPMSAGVGICRGSCLGRDDNGASRPRFARFVADVTIRPLGQPKAEATAGTNAYVCDRDMRAKVETRIRRWNRPMALMTVLSGAAHC